MCDVIISVMTWTVPDLETTIPVRAHVVGTRAGRRFDHMYEFADFQANDTRRRYSPFMVSSFLRHIYDIMVLVIKNDISTTRLQFLKTLWQ